MTRTATLLAPGFLGVAATSGDIPLGALSTKRELSEFVRPGLESRITAWALNLYRLILAETGAAGLPALPFFVVRSIRAGVRAIAASDDAWRSASLGLLMGFGFVDVLHAGRAGTRAEA